jgi:phosphoenolpyruvate synthase/pyruvate phosphate dikinase
MVPVRFRFCKQYQTIYKTQYSNVILKIEGKIKSLNKKFISDETGSAVYYDILFFAFKFLYLKTCDSHQLPTDKTIKRVIKMEEEKTMRRIREKINKLAKKFSKKPVVFSKLKFNPFHLIFVKTTFLAWKRFAKQKFSQGRENEDTDILSVN